MLYRASCHCGAVEVEVEAPERVVCSECNCSICAKGGFLHLILPKSRCRLVRGADSLTTYIFNTGVAKHTFCRVCGIKPFYVPRSNPDGYSVNVRCLDPQPREVVVQSFDGEHWEEHGASLADLSRES